VPSSVHAAVVLSLILLDLARQRHLPSPRPPGAAHGAVNMLRAAVEQSGVFCRLRDAEILCACRLWVSRRRWKPITNVRLLLSRAPEPPFRSRPNQAIGGEADRQLSIHSGRPAASRSFSLKPGDCGFGRPGRTHGQPVKTSVPRYYGASDQVVFADEHRRLRIAQLGCHQVWQSPVVVLGSFLSGYW
jgi:hypothetical protein